jgi:hypothetical protein
MTKIDFLKAIAGQHLNTDNPQKIDAYVKDVFNCQRVKDIVTKFLGIAISHKADRRLADWLNSRYGYRQEVAGLLTVSGYDKFIAAIGSGMADTSAADLVGLHQYRRMQTLLDTVKTSETPPAERAAFQALREDVNRTRAVYGFKLICEAIDRPEQLNKSLWQFRQLCATL